jgi:hypothetical protein
MAGAGCIGQLGAVEQRLGCRGFGGAGRNVVALSSACRAMMERR